MANLRSELRSLALEDVEETGKELGRGAYGVVVEVKLHGFVCAGKKLHEALFLDSRRQARKETAMKFAEECLLHSRQRHPSIVQLIGVHFRPGSSIPTLVMEYLPMSLTQCLEKYPKVPGRVKHEILLDVAHGLDYLHCKKPPIWHRDLTANNVLLTSDVRAKISDLGTSRVIDHVHAIATRLTPTPGNATVMPPEALKENPNYDHKLDVFSFGCLMIHVLIQEWPLPLPQFFKEEDKIHERTELQRRQNYVSKIEATNSLLPCIKECLLNDAAKRPDASSLCMALQHVLSQHPKSSHSRLDLLQDIDAKTNQVLSLVQEKEAQAQEMQMKEQENAALVGKKEENEVCIRNLTETLENTTNQKMQLESQYHQIMIEIAAYKHMATRNQRLIEAYVNENKNLCAEVALKQEELDSVQKQIASLRTQNESKQAELNTLQQQIASLHAQKEAKQTEFSSLQKEIASLHTQNESKQAELNTLQQQIASLHAQRERKQTEFSSLQKEIASLHSQNEMMQADFDTLQKQLASLLTQKEVKQAELEAIQEQIASLRTQNETKQKELVATQKQVTSLCTQNEMKQEELHALQVQIASLQKQNTTIQQENKSLIQQLARMKQETVLPSEIQPADNITCVEEGLLLGPLLRQEIHEGYAVSLQWFCQWQRFVHYEKIIPGMSAAQPGPVSNSNLFVDMESNKVRDNVALGVDYALLPRLAWIVLVSWYGISPKPRPVLLECPLPLYQKQKEKIQSALQQKFKKGDECYLVGKEWFKQWKKYVGFDKHDQKDAGKESAHPGPVDNKALLKSSGGATGLKDGLTEAHLDYMMEGIGYVVLPKHVWNMLICWYGLSEQSRPVMRKIIVVESLLGGDLLEVELYPRELRLCVYPRIDVTKTSSFISTNTIGDVEHRTRKLFHIPHTIKCRLWLRIILHSDYWQLLGIPAQTLADTVCFYYKCKIMLVLEQRNKDGTWPRDEQSKIKQ